MEKEIPEGFCRYVKSKNCRLQRNTEFVLIYGAIAILMRITS